MHGQTRIEHRYMLLLLKSEFEFLIALHCCSRGTLLLGNEAWDNTIVGLMCMWFVPKVSVLIFYLNVYWTHLKLQVNNFKL